MPQFKIEQIALSIPDAAAAQAFLEKIGLTEWFADRVVATGVVFPASEYKGYDYEVQNHADLRFNYQAGNGTDAAAGKPLELEVLDYVKGDSWISENIQNGDAHENQACHLGMHVTMTELLEWQKFFRSEGISIAQSVTTDSHTNPAIAGKRRYAYEIYDTRSIIGIDLKFIVRLNPDLTPYIGESK